MVVLLCFGGMSDPAAAKSRTAKKYAAHTFFDWDYAVWAWTHLRTRDQAVAEYSKYAEPYKKWLKLYDLNPERALAQLETSPDREAIIKGQSLFRANQFYREVATGGIGWMILEPNCYEGIDTSYIRGRVDPMDDLFARMNPLTGECDYPAWASDDLLKYMREKKADFLRKQKWALGKK
jgi:hypothetical protein